MPVAQESLRVEGIRTEDLGGALLWSYALFRRKQDKKYIMAKLAKQRSNVLLGGVVSDITQEVDPSIEALEADGGLDYFFGRFTPSLTDIVGLRLLSDTLESQFNYGRLVIEDEEALLGRVVTVTSLTDKALYLSKVASFRYRFDTAISGVLTATKFESHAAALTIKTGRSSSSYWEMHDLVDSQYQAMVDLKFHDNQRES